MTEFLLYLYAESPLHAGAADSDGALDLPIQREVTTGYPVVWGQSLKGALRQAACAPDSLWSEQEVRDLFGADVTEDEGDARGAGLLTVGDAQLVALPVPTLQRTFAWATSPIALSRLARKYARLRLPGQPPRVPEVGRAQGLCADQGWRTTRDSVLGPYAVPMEVAPAPEAAPAQESGTGQGREKGGGEERGDGEPSNPVAAWADLLARDAVGDDAHLAPFAAKMREDLLVVGSDIMPALTRECVESSVRVQLDPVTKTVRNGPFSSEYLPAETVLATALTLRPGAGRRASECTDLLRSLLCGDGDPGVSGTVQIGGDETLGKGIAWTRLLGGAA